MNQILKVLLKPLISVLAPLLSFIPSTFATLLIAEKEKIFNAPKLVDAIKHEMEMAKEVLKDAEAKGRDDQTNKKVMELRKLVFTVEDIIDDYKLLEQERNRDKQIYNSNDSTNKYSSNNTKPRIKRKNNRSKNKNKITSQCSNGIWGSLTTGYKAMVRFKNTYSISCSIVKIKRVMEKIKGEKGYEIILSFEGTSENVQEQKLNDPGIGPLYKDEKELIGFEKRKREIIDKLDLEKKKDGTGNFVLAIWGEPGVGKTTLARKVYEDEEVRKHFSCYAWITTSQPYKRVDLLKSLFKQFMRSSTTTVENKVNRISAEKGVEKIQESEVIITDRLRSYLQKKHKYQKGYLVILDDVSEMEDLCDIMKAALVPNRTKGRIMITTNRLRIANYWRTSFFCGYGETYNLKVLSKQSSEILFDMKAFGSPGICPWKLENLRNKIVQECDGLPLLIEKVGALFSTTQRWIELYQGFLIDPPLSLNSKTALLSSYYEMPSHLKPCFLYLCMFPKGKELDRMRIVRLWIAEGFVEAKGHNTPEEAAEEYLNELAERGMIRYLERDETERNRTFRLPNMWYHIMLPKLKDLNFCQVLPQTISNVDNQCRRLSIHDDFPDTLPMSTLYVCSILSFVCSKIFPISCPLPRALYQLKVLDLEDAEFVNVPRELGNLHSLKYLSFKNTNIQELPDTISGLWNLQTLNLKQSPITNLPDGIKSLNTLRYLLIGCKKEGHMPDPVQIPKGALLSFTELQKLTYVDGSSEPLLLDLGKLTRLRRLGIVQLTENCGEKLCQAMVNMKFLRSLSINSRKQGEVLDLSYIKNSEENTSNCPPEFLERLYLRGSLKNGLPEWIPKLRHLVKLLLCNSGLKEDPLEHLRVMQELLVLELDNTYDGKELTFVPLAFQNLRVLRIKNMHNLEGIKAKKNSLPKLRKAEFQECPKLNKFPWLVDEPVGMQELLVLQLDNTYNGKELSFGPLGFQKLLELRIQNLPNLERIEVEENGLSHLRKAKIDQCLKLKYIPHQISRCRIRRVI